MRQPRRAAVARAGKKAAAGIPPAAELESTNRHRMGEPAAGSSWPSEAAPRGAGPPHLNFAVHRNMPSIWCASIGIDSLKGVRFSAGGTLMLK